MAQMLSLPLPIGGDVALIKGRFTSYPRTQPATTKSTEKKTLKEFLSSSSDEAENEADKPSWKYFRQFKRSSSLNFDANRENNLIRSLHFLSRSNSTGSAPNPMKKRVTVENQKQRFQKQSSVSSRRSPLLLQFAFFK
ncbi:unnamed protein product [Lupinus luteus]|uniref:Uncharacterized protein n=1 Tax=Lupinus luteus TaxID=3873 RepID=A0AAV1VTU7_LUPLU